MPRTVVIDELHLTVRVPTDLPDAAAVRRALAGRAFVARLRGAARDVVRSIPELARVTISLTR